VIRPNGIPQQDAQQEPAQRTEKAYADVICERNSLYPFLNQVDKIRHHQLRAWKIVTPYPAKIGHDEPKHTQSLRLRFRNRPRPVLADGPSLSLI